MIKILKHTILIIILFLSGMTIHAQENLELYRGNSNYADGEFDEAKVHYEKALTNNPSSYKGTYNLGNANYKQDNFEEAVSIYEQAIAASKSDLEKAEAMHNLGNTYMQSGKFEESIKAYKNSLRLNPNAEDTRYNLAFAKKMMQKEEKQQEDQEQNEDQEEQEENEDKKDQEQEKKDGEDEESDDKGGDKKDSDEEKDKNDSKENEPKDGDQDENGEEESKPQPKPIQLTPREAEQLLEAAKNEDQKIQMQLKKQQKGEPRKIEKDW